MNSAPNGVEYLTVRDIQKILKVSRATAYSYIRGGRLRVHRIGRLVRITPDDLRDFVEGRPRVNKGERKP
jgi:excisionase family DNA binding protein